ncbi:MAG: ABC transporter substrate-binding protein, partial [Anaerolineae bacterium]|nr:ABC transporter substrate-binding protein [Anaerolineae bacterium]
MMRRAWFVLTLTAAALGLTLSGCRRGAKPAPRLRVAVLPILDSLPLYVADMEGFFSEEGIEIELLTAGSAAERDQLLQAGQVDSVITDLVSLALVNRDEIRLVAVRYAMVPTAEVAQFRILAAPNAHVHSPSDLAGAAIGVSEGTVIEYVTERLLAAEGLAPDQIETLAVPKIPDRMALLTAGELTAATLPEPLGSLALQQGAQLVIDDTAHPEVSCSIFAVRADVLTDQPEVVQSFVRAINRASTAINGDRASWADLLSEKGIVPTPLIGSYTLPDYPAPAVPTEAQYFDVAAWLRETGRLDAAPAY